MKRFLISTLLASAALTGSALAQSTSGAAPADPATPTERMDAAPASNAASSSGTAGAGAATGMQSEGGFFTYQEGDQMLGSGLMGAEVWGAEGESIGGVEDLLLDRNGQVMAVVVGVGGFLGIGEKDVAIANDQLEFVLAEETQASASTTAPAATTGMATTGTATTAAAGTATTPAGTTAPAGAAPATVNQGTAAGTSAMGAAGTAMTGMAGTSSGMVGSSNYGWGWTGAGIDRIQVNYTREQLEEAPAFEYAN